MSAQWATEPYFSNIDNKFHTQSLNNVTPTSYVALAMSWTAILVACFIITQASVMAMLVTSGMYSELFGRHRRTARSADSSLLLQAAATTEWVENHEFWEMSDVEEVAF